MWQFIKQTFASVIGTIIGLSLFFTVGISGLIFLLIVSSNDKDEPIVKSKSVLVFDLSLNISDTEPPSSLAEALSGEENNTIPLRQVILAIENASEDNRIQAIFLDGRKTGLGNGYANLKEVRQALLDFKNKGKKIIAYDVDLTESEYYLASLADKIIINPLGAVQINGFSSQQMFFRDAFEKYGIGVQIVRVGDYKTAVEPFVRQNFSPENRQQNEVLLQDIWQDYRENIAENRNSITVNQIQQIADSKGFLNADEALQNKLVDKIAYWDQVVNELQEITDHDKTNQSFNQVSINSYLRLNTNKQQFSNNKIAVIYADGAIVNGQGNAQQIGGDSFAKELSKLREDELVKAVVLRINSPGGSATASEIILREVELISQSKPVIISMGNVAASGGYWIATGGDYIFAQSNTITGSIGVFGLLFNIQEIASNNGINWDEVKTGKFADFQTITRPKNELELARYQTSVQQIYNLFLDRVAQSRNLPKNKVTSIAQGRVWSGKNAQEIGLIDEIGGLNSAIEYVVEKAGLGTDWQVEEYPAKKTFEEEIISNLFQLALVKLGNISGEQIIMPKELQRFKNELMLLQKFNDPKNIYASFLFNLRWE